MFINDCHRKLCYASIYIDTVITNMRNKLLSTIGENVMLKELGQKRVCLGPAGSLWVLNFAQERSCKMSPGDFGTFITFIKAGDNETKEGLRVEEATGEPRWFSAFTLWKCYRKEVSHGGAVSSCLKSQRKRGLGDRFRGLVWDKLLLLVALLFASLLGALRVYERKVKTHA